MNLSFIIGNLGADAEVVSANGNQFVKLSVADSRKYKKQDGTEVSETNWVDATMNDVHSPILPYLKAGTKVAIVGNASLRVYSSKKDRMMKAGLSVRVLSIELCGGSSDSVPRRLIDPRNGAVLDVTKHYWCNGDFRELKKDEQIELLDERGGRYLANKAGFVTPIVEPEQTEDAAKEG